MIPRKESEDTSNEEEEDETEESSEEESDTESEDEELLNKLRFKRKPKTIDVDFAYKAPMIKLEQEVKKLNSKLTYNRTSLIK